jgi:hypothetical protein
MVQFAKKPIAGVQQWQMGTTGSLESAGILTEQIWIQADGWCTVCQYWHFYVEKPVHQQAEDLLDPKDTSRGICTYVWDPMDFEYICILSQQTLCM